MDMAGVDRILVGIGERSEDGKRAYLVGTTMHVCARRRRSTVMPGAWTAAMR